MESGSGKVKKWKAESWRSEGSGECGVSAVDCGMWSAKRRVMSVECRAKSLCKFCSAK